MNRDEKIRLADQAAQVIDNPAYKKAFSRFIEDIARLRLQIGPRDQEGAHKLILMEQTVTKAKSLMDAYIKDGDRAKEQIEEEMRPTLLTRTIRKFRNAA